MKTRRIYGLLALLMSILMLFGGCTAFLTSEIEYFAEDFGVSLGGISEAYEAESESAPLPLEEKERISEDGYYYDAENVVRYLDAYGKLPQNFVTKNDARDAGWEGGSVEEYFEGGAIGGDRFGNREGLLPDGDYFECDIDTLGKDSRGAKRLVFSFGGPYYYTDDHYESFTELTVSESGVVTWH